MQCSYSMKISGCASFTCCFKVFVSNAMIPQYRQVVMNPLCMVSLWFSMSSQSLPKNPHSMHLIKMLCQLLDSMIFMSLDLRAPIPSIELFTLGDRLRLDSRLAGGPISLL